MCGSTSKPKQIARLLAERRDSAGERRRQGAGDSGAWRKETFVLPREEARAKAREWFERYPKAAYMTAIESWKILDRDTDNEKIEFTMRRLPSAE